MTSVEDEKRQILRDSKQLEKSLKKQIKDYEKKLSAASNAGPSEELAKAERTIAKNKKQLSQQEQDLAKAIEEVLD